MGGSIVGIKQNVAILNRNLYPPTIVSALIVHNQSSISDTLNRYRHVAIDIHLHFESAWNFPSAGLSLDRNSTAPSIEQDRRNATAFFFFTDCDIEWKK